MTKMNVPNIGSRYYHSENDATSVAFSTAGTKPILVMQAPQGSVSLQLPNCSSSMHAIFLSNSLQIV